MLGNILQFTGSSVTVDLTENLIAHYLLNNNADDSHGIYDGTEVGTVDFTGDQLDPLSGSITIPSTGGTWCSYWKDIGSGMVFTTSIAVPTSLSTDNYSNLRIYSETKTGAFLTALEDEGYYPKPLPLPTTVGLIAHYHLTGTAEEVTGNYDGTEVGVTYVDDVEFGSVASFDGVTNRVEFVTDPTGGVSLSFWVKFDELVTSHSIMGNNSTTFHVTAWQANIVRAYLTGSGSSSYFTLQSSWTTGVWYNIVVQYEGGNTWKSYSNGIFQFSYTDATSTFSILNFGDNPTDRAYNLEGRLHDVRIYNTALTPTEITDIYNYEKNFRPIDIDDGLIAFYPLGNNSLDNYHNENDGVDTNVTYDGTQATITGSIVFPTAVGFVEAYYIHNGVHLKTVIETDLNSLVGTLSDVRKYNKTLTSEQQQIIGYI